MRWRIAILKAAAITLGVFLIVFGLVAVQAARQFDGKCGGLFPFLGEPQPCSLAQYVWSDVSFTFGVFFYVFWYVALAFVAIVLAVILIRERRNRG
jgi:hypothetical protein